MQGRAGRAREKMTERRAAEMKQGRERELFHAYLRQNTLKKTHQKDLILDLFLQTEGHMSVDDLHALVRKRNRRIGVVTVFRTLKSLLACGIAREINLGDGVTRYEHSYLHPHHHHIVCTECGKTIEFISPELERLQDQVVRRYRFHPAQHRLEIYGKCERCSESETPNASAAPDFSAEAVFARDALRMAIRMERQGVEFCREAASRNADPQGNRIFDRWAAEVRIHLGELLSELSELEKREPGIGDAPQFLHFDAGELDGLFPDLGEYETGGELKLGANEAIKLSAAMAERSARFFEQYAQNFGNTRGKEVFMQFAKAELRHSREVRNS